jgi:hypothetical protein
MAFQAEVVIGGAPRMKTPASFALLCEGLHQDALLDAHTIDALATACLSHVPEAQREELAAFLDAALAKLLPSELKGLISRQKTSVRFKSDTAAAFLSSALDQLSRP